MSLAEIDQWIGKTLFIPPVIKLCQITRQSQFAMSRLFWFAAACDGLYRSETLVQSIFFGVICIAAMLTAALRADFPTQSMMPFRLFSVGLLIFDIIEGVGKGDLTGAEFWIFVLFAEYASTIRTIPPSQNEKRKRTGASAQSSGGI